MPRTLLEFFADEAGDYLGKLEKALAADEEPNGDEIRRLARALKGSARMADQDAIVRAASAVQSVAEDLASGRRHWAPDLARTLKWAVAEIREMVASVEDPPADLALRAGGLAERLGESVAPAPPPVKDEDRFRRYIGTELRGLASEIGDALSVLERDPRNREPLKKLLRRIRPLRGVEGIDEIPSVGPAVAAVEEVILRIADTSATVGPGHLALFRRAQQALDEVATDLIRGQKPGAAPAGREEFEDLKDKVLSSVAERDVAWISELFHDDPGPHIEKCPMAEQGAGSWDAFFALEATGSLDTIDRLREGLVEDGDAGRRNGERLATSFRQLRERAVTFGHEDLGRISRRAGAVIKAAVEGPTWRLQAIAIELAVTVAALRSYLGASTENDRASAIERAERSLEVATHPTVANIVDIESLTYSADDAVARAKSLSAEAGGILQSGEPDFGRARSLLEEALGLVQHALGKSDATR